MQTFIHKGSPQTTYKKLKAVATGESGGILTHNPKSLHNPHVSHLYTHTPHTHTYTHALAHARKNWDLNRAGTIVLENRRRRGRFFSCHLKLYRAWAWRRENGKLFQMTVWWRGVVDVTGVQRCNQANKRPQQARTAATRFYFVDHTSTRTTDTRSQAYIVSAGAKKASTRYNRFVNN